MNKKSFFVVIALLFVFTSCSPPSTTTSQRSSSIDLVDPPTQSQSQTSTISWNQADQFVGEACRVDR